MNKLTLDQAQVRDRVAEYLTENGLYKMRRADIQEYMQDKLINSKQPTLNEIG